MKEHDSCSGDWGRCDCNPNPTETRIHEHRKDGLAYACDCSDATDSSIEIRIVDPETGGEKKWRAPRPTEDIPKSVLGWLAGLIEGEGSFYIAKHDTYPCARFQLSMTDQDVVLQAHEIAGVGNVRIMKPGPRSVKDQWRWRVAAQAEVAWLMDQVYYWMGERRQKQIDASRRFLPSWTEKQS